MSDTRPQTAANHARIDPWFHYCIVPIFVLTLIFSLFAVVHEPSLSHAWLVIVSLGLLLLAFRARIYALRVQDRVIRLEERLRLGALLPEPLDARIPELSERQLIALRFASDAEVPVLVQRIVHENLPPAEIKKLIQIWRPDYWRV